MEIKSRDGSGKRPDLEIGRVPNEIYFLARGEGPYLLAYGNANIEQPERPVSRLMQVLTRDQQNEFVSKASLGDQVSLKGETALVKQE